MSDALAREIAGTWRDCRQRYARIEHRQRFSLRVGVPVYATKVPEGIIGIACIPTPGEVIIGARVLSEEQLLDAREINFTMAKQVALLGVDESVRIVEHWRDRSAGKVAELAARGITLPHPYALVLDAIKRPSGLDSVQVRFPVGDDPRTGFWITRVYLYAHGEPIVPERYEPGSLARERARQLITEQYPSTYAPTLEARLFFTSVYGMSVDEINAWYRGETRMPTLAELEERRLLVAFAYA